MACAPGSRRPRARSRRSSHERGPDMAKAKKKSKEAPTSAGPKFTGFNALAAGLGDLKAKLDEEKKRDEKEVERRKAEGKPPPPPPPPARRAAPSVPQTPTSAADDELTFHRMMSGVTPLESRAKRVAVAGEARVEAGKVKPADLREKARKEAADVLDHLHHL